MWTFLWRVTPLNTLLFSYLVNALLPINSFIQQIVSSPSIAGTILSRGVSVSKTDKISTLRKLIYYNPLPPICFVHPFHTHFLRICDEQLIFKTHIALGNLVKSLHVCTLGKQEICMKSFFSSFQENKKREKHRCANFINSFYNVIEMPKE